MKINRVVLGIFLFCFFSIAIVPVVYGASTPPYAPDERFGFAGSCGIAKDLSILWAQNWGHGMPYANQAEIEGCIHSNGRKAFLTLGKLDNNEKYTDQGIYAIPSLENKFLSDPTTTNDEKGWYNDVRTVLHNQKAYYAAGACEGATDPSALGKNACYDNAKSSFLLIKYKYTNDSASVGVVGGGQKGLTYAITNEPDLGPAMSPADYVKYYMAFYQMVKKYDPTAQIMVGGVTEGYPSPRSTDPSKPNQWVNDIIAEYKKQYNTISPLPVDIWGVHIYVWDNWESSARRSLAMRSFLDGLGYTGIPIWLTEMGTGLNEGAVPDNIVNINMGPYYNTVATVSASEIERIHEGLLTPAQREQDYALVTARFMKPIIRWLKGETEYNGQKSNGTIAKWFWFYGDHFYGFSRYKENGKFALLFKSVDWAGNIYKRIGSTEYNPLGPVYTQLMDIPVLVNKGFETSTVTPYGYSFWQGSPQAHEEIDTTEKNTGKQSIKISVGNVAGPNGFTAAITQTINNSAFSGKYVQFSVNCKTAASAKAYIKIDVTDAAGVRNTWWTPGVSPQTECPAWKQIKTDIVQIPLGTTKLDLGVLPAGQNVVVWFDDFNIDVKECSHKFEGDANCDDTITFSGDFPILANEITQQIDISTRADFNRDGKVNLQDFEILRRTLFPNP